jgi:hypothetical protein
MLARVAAAAFIDRSVLGGKLTGADRNLAMPGA